MTDEPRLFARRLAKSRLIPTTESGPVGVMTQKQVGFNYLPDGLLLDICAYLDMESLVSLSQVRLQISPWVSRLKIDMI
jgi:hypothetical protein